MDRRQFLKVGLAGGAVLAGAGVWVAWRGADADEESAMLAAVAAAVLDSALPANPEARRLALQETVNGVRQSVAGLSAAAQQEVAELFALLTAPAGRLLLARVWPGWRHASVEDVSAFLRRWRRSRFGLLRAGYAALHDLVLGTWYANPTHWPAIGYAGPPKLR